MRFSLSEYTKIDVGPHWVTGGPYSAPPDLTGFKGAASRQQGNGGEGKEGLWEGEEGKGRMEWKRGKLGQ